MVCASVMCKCVCEGRCVLQGGGVGGLGGKGRGGKACIGAGARGCLHIDGGGILKHMSYSLIVHAHRPGNRAVGPERRRRAHIAWGAAKGVGAGRGNTVTGGVDVPRAQFNSAPSTRQQNCYYQPCTTHTTQPAGRLSGTFSHPVPNHPPPLAPQTLTPFWPCLYSLLSSGRALCGPHAQACMGSPARSPTPASTANWT